MHRIRFDLLGAALAALAAVAALPAGAAAARGTIHIYAPGTGVSTPIVITGAITDYGKVTTVTKTGKVDENGDYDRVVLKKGSFWIDAIALEKKLNATRPTIDRVNCFFSLRGSGPTTLFKGTGAYAGISGTVQVELDFVLIAPRTANGKCDISDKAQPVAQYGNVTGSGTVTFG